MKSLITNLLLLTMGLSVYSCNEKISPELKTGSTTTNGPSVIVPSQYYFKVTNQSPAILNYVLHRTGPGNGTSECTIASNGFALSSGLYTSESGAPHDSKMFDISCFMEAEELSLQFNGLDFNIEASANTCEYIGYAPYSYMDNIPGSSSVNYSGISCSADAVKSGLSPSAIATANGVIDQTGPVGCGYMVDLSVPVGQRVRRTIPKEKQTLCAYDYSREDTSDYDGNQNCDIGKINIHLTNIELVPEVEQVDDGNGNITVPYVAAYLIEGPDTDELHSCGGKLRACMEGAIKLEPTLAKSATASSVIYNTTQNNTFVKKVELPALIGKRVHNSDIVNYRRGLAALDLDYQDYTAGNNGNWADANYNKSFDPNLMEKYAANRNPDGTYVINAFNTAASNLNPTVTYATWIAKIRENGWTSVPYAADPFLGISGAKTNPFYTFYCLDRAQEIRARIRLVVRDWDKVFPSAVAERELLSDVHKLAAARQQDLPIDLEEIPGDPGNYNYFDDIWDWDVRVPMTRTDPNGIGVYDPSFTRWQPTAGWWEPGHFPMEGPPEKEAEAEE
jgi:hypothetical protein